MTLQGWGNAGWDYGKLGDDPDQQMMKMLGGHMFGNPKSNMGFEFDDPSFNVPRGEMFKTPGMDELTKPQDDKWSKFSKIAEIIGQISKGIGDIEGNYWAQTGTPRGEAIRDMRKTEAAGQQGKVEQMMKMMEIQSKFGNAQSSLGKILADAGKFPPYSNEDLEWAANIKAKGGGGGSSTSINMGNILDPETQQMLGRFIKSQIGGMEKKLYPQEVPTASGTGGAPMSPAWGVIR